MGAQIELEGDLESLLSCPICMDDYDDPRMLPCQHSFCEQCLTKFIKDSSKPNKTSGVKMFRCPMCRNKTKEHIDANDGSGFPESLTISRLLQSKDKLVEHNGHSSDETEGDDETVAEEKDSSETPPVQHTTSRYKAYVRPKRRGTSAKRKKESRNNPNKVTPKTKKENQGVAIVKRNLDHDHGNDLFSYLFPESYGDIVIRKMIVPMYAHRRDSKNTFTAYMWLLIAWIVLLYTLRLYPCSTTLLSGLYVVGSYKSTKAAVSEHVRVVAGDSSKFTVFAYFSGKLAFELTVFLISLYILVIIEASIQTLTYIITYWRSAQLLNNYMLYFNFWSDIFITCPAFRLEAFCRDLYSIIQSL